MEAARSSTDLGGWSTRSRGCAHGRGCPRCGPGRDGGHPDRGPDRSRLRHHRGVPGRADLCRHRAAAAHRARDRRQRAGPHPDRHGRPERGERRQPSARLVRRPRRRRPVRAGLPLRQRGGALPVAGGAPGPRDVPRAPGGCASAPERAARCRGGHGPAARRAARGRPDRLLRGRTTQAGWSSACIRAAGRPAPLDLDPFAGDLAAVGGAGARPAGLGARGRARRPAAVRAGCGGDCGTAWPPPFWKKACWSPPSPSATPRCGSGRRAMPSSSRRASPGPGRRSGAHARTPPCERPRASCATHSTAPWTASTGSTSAPGVSTTSAPRRRRSPASRSRSCGRRRARSRAPTSIRTTAPRRPARPPISSGTAWPSSSAGGPSTARTAGTRA